MTAKLPLSSLIYKKSYFKVNEHYDDRKLNKLIVMQLLINNTHIYISDDDTNIYIYADEQCSKHIFSLFSFLTRGRLLK